MRKIITMLGALVSPLAISGSWTNQFTITQIYVAGASNSHFRVFGMNGMSECSASPYWAFLNESDSGAQGKISTLLTAYTTKKKVKLYVQPNSNNRCQIVEISMSD